MINTKDTPVHPDGSPSNERGLEEVRLRQQAIGVKLRHMFDEVVNEPVPDEFSRFSDAPTKRRPPRRDSDQHPIPAPVGR